MNTKIPEAMSVSNVQNGAVFFFPSFRFSPILISFQGTVRFQCPIMLRFFPFSFSYFSD